MKKILNLAILISLLAGASILSCADSESRSALAGDATVIINLGLPTNNETARSSIIDRVLRFFTSDAVAATTPAAFANISIRVSGDGIGSIAKDFAPTSVISLTVPGGGLRTFDVTAQVAPGDPSAALTFRGTTVANVPGGETVHVPVLMMVGETKLVIPDYYNQRLVMMDGINGANTITRNATQIFSTARTLNPYDVDFDARGRIYYANNVAGTSAGIFRMDTINSTWADVTCTQLVLVPASIGVRSIAIDRKRNMLYYVDESDDLYQLNLDGGSSELLLASNVGTGLGIGKVCVDEASGILYLSYVFGSLVSNPFIRGFDPVNLTWVTPAYNSGAAAFDITVKGRHLYAAFIALGEIRRLPLDLDPLVTPVVLTTKPDDTDAFIGPTEFIAITNRKLFVLDDSAWSDPDDRVVSFDDIDGSGWETTETPGTFRFYYMC